MKPDIPAFGKGFGRHVQAIFLAASQKPKINWPRPTIRLFGQLKTHDDDFFARVDEVGGRSIDSDIAGITLALEQLKYVD